MDQQIEDLKAIRSLMEKSTKFQLLNGLSIVFAGVFALIGALVAYLHISSGSLNSYDQINDLLSKDDLSFLLLIAFVTLFLSIGVIIFFSWRKAKRSNLKLVGGPTLRAAYSLAIPLIAGGIFSFIFLMRANLEITIASTLIFYGLGLISASKYTFPEIHYLGILQVVLGLICTYLMNHSLLVWALGFGLCHVIFGIIMYVKYDLKNR